MPMQISRIFGDFQAIMTSLYSRVAHRALTMRMIITPGDAVQSESALEHRIVRYNLECGRTEGRAASCAPEEGLCKE